MGQPEGQMEDAIDGFIQIGNNPILLVCFISTILTLVIAQTAGIGISRKVSAVFRLVMDSLRTILVWAVSISVPDFNQGFQPLQIVGFFIISLGVLVFNDVLIGEFKQGYEKISKKVFEAKTVMSCQNELY